MDQSERRRAIRIAIGVIGLFMPIFGLMHAGVGSDAGNPLWWPRLLLAGVSIGIIGGSYLSAWIREYLFVVWSAFLYIVVGFVFFTGTAHGFSGVHRLELLVAVTVCSGAYAITARRTQPLLYYLVFMAFLVGAGYVAPLERGAPDLMIGFLLCVAVILGCVAYSRVRLTDALSESEQRWGSLVENHPDPMIVTRDAEIVYANPAVGELMDVPSEKLLGQSVLDIVHEEDRTIIEQRLANATTGEALPVIEYRIPLPQSEEIIVEVVSVPIQFRGGLTIQSVIHDVTDQRVHEHRLVEAKEHAEAESRAKSSFLANMSHEIRSPLTNIIGFADLLAVEVPDELETHVQSIQRSGRRLQETLDSVLRFAQLESGAVTFSHVVGDYRQVVEEVVDSFQVRAEEKELDLSFHTAESEVMGTFDRGLVDRIVSNLVSNAVKYTEEGEIRVSVQRSGDRVVVEVEDTGIGMSESFLSTLYDAFRQESQGLGRSYEGVGLGLAITKRLVALAEGSIEVESERGVGSTFRVELPLEMKGAAADAEGLPGDFQEAD